MHLQAHECVKGQWRAIEILQTFVNAAHARTSTSGRVMPEHFIRQHFGRAPDQVFSRVGFSGDHSRTIQVVQSGAFEVGALDFTVFDLESQQCQLLAKHDVPKELFE